MTRRKNQKPKTKTKDTHTHTHTHTHTQQTNTHTTKHLESGPPMIEAEREKLMIHDTCFIDKPIKIIEHGHS